MKQESPKHILITGASSGIGEALALSYAGMGVRLSLCGRNMQRLQSVGERCSDKGAIVGVQVLDVSDKDATEKWIRSCNSDAPLDLVIANAGISAGTGNSEKQETEDQAREIFAVNWDGVLNTIFPALSLMKEQGKGQIAFMSSLAGFRGWPSAPAYCASKAAVRVFGEGLRGMLAGSGVKINVICPGFVTSRMTDANDFPMPFKWETDKAAKYIKKKLAQNVGRIAFPIPIISVIWFLSFLPDSWAQAILKRSPSKKSL